VIAWSVKLGVRLSVISLYAPVEGLQMTSNAHTIVVRAKVKGE
jgi:hypothetical protein